MTPGICTDSPSLQILQTVAGGSRGIGYIYAGRVIAGVGIGAISAVAPAFVSECAPKEVRGRITGLFQIMVAIGVMISYFINCESFSAIFRVSGADAHFSGRQPTHPLGPERLAHPVRLPARPRGDHGVWPAHRQGVPAVARVQGPHRRGAAQPVVHAQAAARRRTDPERDGGNRGRDRGGARGA